MDDTPLQNDHGKFNFPNVKVDFRAGTNDQEYIDGFFDRVMKSRVCMNNTKIIALISEKIDEKPYFSLENFALYTLKEKLSSNSASSEEKLLIINEFLSNYLEFNPETDEPIGRTHEVEEMIDFLLG